MIRYFFVKFILIGIFAGVVFLLHHNVDNVDDQAIIKLSKNCERSVKVNSMHTDILTEQPKLVDFSSLQSGFSLLPEQSITFFNESTAAFYADPTSEYAHAILGDEVEAKTLVGVFSGQVLSIRLAADYVFEDIAPRLS